MNIVPEDEGRHGQMKKTTTWIVTGHRMITMDDMHPTEGDLRSAGIIRLLFAVGTLFLIGVCHCGVGEYQKNKHHKEAFYK